MIGVVIFVGAVIGLIVWLISKEARFHEETGDYNGFRLTLIWTLVIFLFACLFSGSCESKYSGRDGEGGGGWVDR